ncbi:MAG: cupredoxin domain-containing protein [Candidatus Dormibacteraeota bacterium]|uniref:Cupredoxin domain-containing protein n=1 Tax=Candidatus Amunia macphersoniae TaxID=3127014 RepID=A0A934NIC1_9BACT|nr:cupredoxin domain-containing protein [Candidatus Dormibacteraeota bacterium]
MRPRFLILIAACTIGTAGCGGGASSSPSQSSPPASSGANNAVTIRNFAFAPPNLQIAAGTAVTWTNNEPSTAHTTTADKSDPATWDSGNLAPGGSFSNTFATAGTYKYHCSIHDYMTATITVR